MNRALSFNLVWVLIALASCKSVDLVGQLQDISPNEPLLPKLEPIWDDEQFTMLFGNALTAEDERVAVIPDVRALDLQLLYDQTIRGGVAEIQGESFGYAVLSIDIHTHPAPLSPLLTATQILTLTVPSWFGVPFKVNRTECIAVVDILDSQNRTLGKYSGIGRGKSPTSLYRNGDRLGPIEAFSSALDQIQAQIAGDHASLILALHAAGPVSTEEQ